MAAKNNKLSVPDLFKQARQIVLQALQVHSLEAHQQSRKADKYLKNGRYDDAIECHRKAAEYLTKAMAATTIQQALESLSLQRESHIRQQAVIREKQRRALLVDRQTPPDRSRNTVTSKPSEESSTTGRSEEGVEMTDQDSMGIYRTMEECDSLLQFLNNRTTTTKGYANKLEGKGDVQDKTSAQRIAEGVKTAKDDKTIIEELRLHNDALRSHILQFLKESEEQQRQTDYYQRELEYTRKENRDLKDRLSKVEHGKVDHMPLVSEPLQQDTFYSMPMALNLDKLPSLELPPLEMPKFDFDSLKTNHDEDAAPSSQ